MKEIESIIIFPIVFTCKNDEDCYGNGYCHARKCKCYPNYEYAEDCSHHGCKYIHKAISFWLKIVPRFHFFAKAQEQ